MVEPSSIGAGLTEIGVLFYYSDGGYVRFSGVSFISFNASN
jgi:hypothetical protein